MTFGLAVSVKKLSPKPKGSSPVKDNEFCCNGTVVHDKELGKVIQLQGGQRKNVSAFLARVGIVTSKKEQIKIHEFLIESISTDLDFFDDSYATKTKKKFTDSFEGLYNIHYTNYGNPTTTESSSRGGGSSSRASHGNQVTTLLRRLKEHKNKKARNDPSLSSEYEQYVHSDFVTHLQTTEFETFDVVASESAFLTSGRVLSTRRTRLTPMSLEMCMCLKDHLDAQERKQDKSTLETPVYFEEEILDAEVQANEAISLSDEEIALDAASSEGEEAEDEANYGYDVYHDDY
uniref:Zinc finger BED domain-containing protein RICESLEEPER 2 n=1 Tax=Tanacetum cinerariifolium TaxID=118510 RepID=A0A6L2JEK3_TANCI|nr:zinc finger BED domain-containing protein RICESLEEPER 2 [Tanacetum cinerariifolium]